jgi:hypothetical protein
MGDGERWSLWIGYNLISIFLNLVCTVRFFFCVWPRSDRLVFWVCRRFFSPTVALMDLFFCLAAALVGRRSRSIRRPRFLDLFSFFRHRFTVTSSTPRLSIPLPVSADRLSLSLDSAPTSVFLFPFFCCRRVSVQRQRVASGLYFVCR